MQQAIVMLSLYLEPSLQYELQQMNNSNYHFREMATKRAASYGVRALPLLRISIENSTSQEVRSRCQAAISTIEFELGAYSRVYPTNYPFNGYPKIGFLGATNYPKSTILVPKYLGQVAKHVQAGGTQTTLGSREATRLFVNDLLISGTPRDEIQKTINLMMEKERIWWQRENPGLMPSELKVRSKLTNATSEDQK